MRRCIYCLQDLELTPVAVGVKACVRCGLEYAIEFLDEITEERWEEILTSDAYEINRSPGHPPGVTITELVR